MAKQTGEPMPMQRKFLVLHPNQCPKDSFQSLTFTRLPAALKSTHFWSFEFNDKLRKRKGSVWSWDHSKASGIRVTAEGTMVLDAPEVKAMATTKKYIKIKTKQKKGSAE